MARLNVGNNARFFFLSVFLSSCFFLFGWVFSVGRDERERLWHYDAKRNRSLFDVKRVQARLALLAGKCESWNVPACYRRKSRYVQSGLFFLVRLPTVSWKRLFEEPYENERFLNYSCGRARWISIEIPLNLPIGPAIFLGPTGNTSAEIEFRWCNEIYSDFFSFFF